MESKWKTYLLYGSLIIVGGGLVFILLETIRAKNTGLETKTLWDWMELIVIPLVLAISAFMLNNSVRKNEQMIATDHQRETALQAYFDRMTGLLLGEKFKSSKNKVACDIARTQTLTVLRGLDATRKGLVVQFLHEARLISTKGPIIDLEGANLRDANLCDANLFSANFEGVNLSGANLKGANLRSTNLRTANLSNANLNYASLGDADLWDANLVNADLRAAGLREANLLGAKVSEAQLEKVGTLKGATMPDGTVHE